ncbi:MAG: TetR family transcriptional regulator [Gordonia sp.]|nr:TetR family transcriptional regulator [Gordonia sp. (in: high G+C Gram-positive bacteria)]
MSNRPNPASGRSGSTLSPDLTGSITEAVLAELAEVGYGQLSMDGVARRAKAGKSALYRRWPSKQEMILDAVTGVSVPAVEVDASQDLRAIVTVIVGSVDDWLSSGLARRILPDLIAEALRNPALDEALTERIGVMRRGHWRKVFEERIATGEVDADADIEYALDLLAGPVFWRVCGRRQESSQTLRENVVQSVLDVLSGR